MHGQTARIDSRTKYITLRRPTEAVAQLGTMNNALHLHSNVVCAETNSGTLLYINMSHERVGERGTRILSHLERQFSLFFLPFFLAFLSGSVNNGAYIVCRLYSALNYLVIHIIYYTNEKAQIAFFLKGQLEKPRIRNRIAPCWAIVDGCGSREWFLCDGRDRRAPRSVSLNHECPFVEIDKLLNCESLFLAHHC